VPPPSARRPARAYRSAPTLALDTGALHNGWPPPSRSTLDPKSSEDSSAPRRRLAAGGATEQLAGSARRQSRSGRWPGAEPSWLPSTAEAVHRKTVGWPSARPLGVAQEVRIRTVPLLRCPVLDQRPASIVRCERPGSTRACPRDRCPVSGAGPSVQVSGVRCPVWASGVRAFPRPLCPTGVRSWRAAVGRQPHGWDGRGRRGRPPVHDRLVVCPSRNLAIEAGVGRAGASGGVGLNLAVVVGGGLGSG
jgi:hypothetical protein